jgi:hypothetical protein
MYVCTGPNAGRLVSVGYLVDAVWDERPLARAGAPALVVSEGPAIASIRSRVSWKRLRLDRTRARCD